jgi:ATP-dependent Clp protease ATP-binding subunit ClpX
VLFICGGAFDGLERIVEERVGKRAIGFGSEAPMGAVERGKVLEKLMPEDLLKFGLIPEFIGRLPVMVTLTAADRRRPRARADRAQERGHPPVPEVPLARQGRAGVHPGALRAAAEVALDRKTGARALRSIVEESLLEVMYDIPERSDVRRCIITEETIRAGRAAPPADQDRVDKGVDETNYEEWLAARARPPDGRGRRSGRAPEADRPHGDGSRPRSGPRTPAGSGARPSRARA